MNLKDILLETKTAYVEFDGLDGFVIEISAISRELSRKIKKESEITKLDPRMKIPVQELDEEKFLFKFASAAIKGWKGLTYRHLTELVLIDTSGISNLDEEVEFTTDNAVTLLKSSPTFDSWINEQVFSLDRFRDGEKGSDARTSKDISS